MSPLSEVRLPELRYLGGYPRPHRVPCTKVQLACRTQLQKGSRPLLTMFVLPSSGNTCVTAVLQHPLPPASAHRSSTVSFLAAGIHQATPQVYLSFHTALKYFFST